MWNGASGAASCCCSRAAPSPPCESAGGPILHSFDYASPDSLEELLRLLDRHGSDARILAGGTDLMVRMRSGRMLPRVVIDLKRVSSLRSDIVETDSCLRIGARTV